ncbi:AAA family ATPase, partial [Streptomyces sp. NPDC000931]|uniref:AAA family ATPase n=1 Tax=Streptomyces sp. NPDC000931 TaxID=3154372 RepID=UPI0033330E63
MPRIGQAAMEAALTYFHDKDQFQTKVSSAWEAFLVGRVFDSRGTTNVTIAGVNEVISELFTFAPDHPEGRLKPFRYTWGQAKDSGRKTVWNQTTRGTNLSTSLFSKNDIRHGLLPNAVSILQDFSPGSPSKEALTALLTRSIDFAPNATWTEAHEEARNLLGMEEAEYDTISDATISLGHPLISSEEWVLEKMPDTLRPVDTSTIKAPVKNSAMLGQQAQTELVIESRIERMIRRAVARFQFILLVGPPGTGKGTLVSWITEQVRADPASFGFPAGFNPDPMWRTPDESWSAFDLIGGLAPDQGGVLKWSPGTLLNALHEDRWLVLDETNRADMDKIMGPLLTWLSLQSVEVGHDSAHNGHPITLDWTDDAVSSVKDGAYRAGTAWRLFGTYNPADAQRVFRLGTALSRRFVVIPVP